METRTRLLALLLAGAGALLGAAGLVSGLTWLSACGVVLLAGATTVIVAVRPRPQPEATTCAAEPAAAPPKPRTCEWRAAGGVTPPQPTVAASAPPAPTRTYRIRAPISAEPSDVVAALAQNAELAGEILAAHLWLEDTPSGTLRLVAAWGSDVPNATPVDIRSTTLGRALASGSSSLMIEDGVGAFQRFGPHMALRPARRDGRCPRSCRRRHLRAETGPGASGKHDRGLATRAHRCARYPRSPSAVLCCTHPARGRARPRRDWSISRPSPRLFSTAPSTWPPRTLAQ